MNAQRIHHDFDMNKTLTDEQSRSQIWTMLTSANLEKYMDNIIEAGIDFLAFGHLSRSDMRRLGIVNHEEQDRLIEILKPLQAMYRELDSLVVNWTQIANNLEEASKSLAGALTEMNLSVLKKHPIIKQSLVDNETPSFKAALMLVDLMESRLDLIDQDVRKIVQKVEADARNVDRRRYSRSKMVAFSLLALTAISAACYFKTPSLRKL